MKKKAKCEASSRARFEVVASSSVCMLLYHLPSRLPVLRWRALPPRPRNGETRTSRLAGLDFVVVDESQSAGRGDNYLFVFAWAA